MVQSELVARLITERTGRRVELVGVTTLGDVSRAQLTQIGGTGVFVSALREALLGGEVDLAVHSLKDLPAGAAPGIALAAVPAPGRPAGRAGRPGTAPSSPTCPPGARIGTGSPRRAAQLLAAPRRPAAGADPRERRHPAAQGQLTASSTRWCWPAPGWPGSASIDRHHPGLRARRDAARPRPGRAGRRVPRRRPRTGRAARGGQRRGQHGRRGRRTQPAGGPRGRLQRAGRRVRGRNRATARCGPPC